MEDEQTPLISTSNDASVQHTVNTGGTNNNSSGEGEEHIVPPHLQISVAPPPTAGGDDGQQQHQQPEGGATNSNGYGTTKNNSNHQLQGGRTEDPANTGGELVPETPLIKRPSLLHVERDAQHNKLDPKLLVSKTRVAQSENGKELLVSRFHSMQARSIVSDVAIANKPFKRVGKKLNEDEYDDYGQWVSEANNTFDSLDFDDYETQVLQEARVKRDGRVDPPKWQGWAVIVLAGLLTGLVAYGIDNGIKYLMWIKFQATEHFLHTPSEKYFSNETTINNAANDSTIETGTALAVYCALNLAYACVAASLVIFGEPLAKGSGIGEIKCFLNGIKIQRVVRLKTLCCKALGILFSVASGLPCGKEGPMIHSGAAIAVRVSTAKNEKLLPSGFFKEFSKFRSDRHRRNFATAGAAAGVGAAFGAPVGGLLFAVEEVGSFWNLELTVMVFLCSAIAPWVLQILMHPTGTASVNGLISFGHITGVYEYYDLLFCALLGILGGCIGSGFIKLSLILTKWRKANCKSKARKFIEVIVVSFLCSLTLMLLVCYGYECIPIPPPDGKVPGNSVLLKDLKQYGCHKEEYNDMATYFFRSMEDTIHLLTHSNEHIGYKTLILHLVCFYPLTIMTYGINVPSGLFLPTLALGCTFGHIYAQLWNLILPENIHLDPSYYGLFGATAVLGGIVRMTISVIVIIMESTANTTFFYPLVIVTMVAKLVGDYGFTHGIYDEEIEANHIPLLESKMERPEMNMMCAGDVMNSDLVMLTETPTVADLITALKANPHSGSILIVDNEGRGRLEGILLRRIALILIDHRAWETELHLEHFKKTEQEHAYLHLKKYKFFDCVPKDAHPKKINLRRYIDRWPFTFKIATPLNRIYRSFRELGLRHIIVVNREDQPIGIIGRKQLTYLEMADARSLPPVTHKAAITLGTAMSEEEDLESDSASPVTMTSWRALDEWQEGGGGKGVKETSNTTAGGSGTPENNKK